MLLSDGERLVLLASLQWAAMQHEKDARELDRKGKRIEAFQKAAFSGECARLADLFGRQG